MNYFILPIKKQPLYSPMLATFGGGSVRGFGMGSGGGGLYDFTSFTFTNAGRVGRNGPTLSQMQTAYSSTSWTQDTAFLSSEITGVQTWTVPLDGRYNFVVAGSASLNEADGSQRLAGKGRKINAAIDLVAGTKINLIVGQTGTLASNNYESGGGGASSVFDSGVAFGSLAVSNLFVISGAGAGASEAATSDASKQDGSYSFTAAASGNTSTGNGGPAGSAGTNRGAGGGGFLTNGANFNNPDGSGGAAGTIYGGFSWLNGNLGGYPPLSPLGDGGFGGGGAARGRNYAGGGGGGGYTGGTGGDSNGTVSGGGGSYVRSRTEIASYSDGGVGSAEASGFISVTLT
tara:strand:- start:500 stop:1534 length:1035 start_codon:yes stop_codon:yes gene_type:complete